LPDRPSALAKKSGRTKDVNEVRVTLPYLDVIKDRARVSPSEVDVALRECLAMSREYPIYIELLGAYEQWVAFFEATIREFVAAMTREASLEMSCRRLDDKILHSLLILFQKKAALKLLSSLVDLDNVLDGIETERKSCVVAASQRNFLAILRYERGHVTAFCHEQSSRSPRERSFRDDFLVRIYTLSAAEPLEINVYDDLLVKYASDARVIESGYKGSISGLFVSRPPVVTLEFKNKEIGHWILDKPTFKIGRGLDNDIAIDNLAVSRVHAVIAEEKGQHYVRDCDSLNGTVVNGRRVGRTLLRDGDQIQIGKHKIVFRTHGGGQLVAGPTTDRFDQTVIMHAGKKGTEHRITTLVKPRPRLVAKGKAGDRVFEIHDSRLTIGKDGHADIELDGVFVAKQHAEITRENGNYVIRHLAGRRRLTVGGKPVKEWILRNNDRVKIGKMEFVFEE
jgi:pSer/pThr/pTyr-binding forkhead associated (FHA) protein